MPGPLDKGLKDRMAGHFTKLRGERAAPPVNEVQRLKRVITEQCAVRRVGMTGDPAEIDARCLGVTLGTLDIAALCPTWHAAMRAEHAARQELVAESRKGVAYANMLLVQVSAARPELESMEALVRHYVRNLKLD